MRPSTLQPPPVTGPSDGKKLFKKLGSCSRTYHHLLNREFGHPEPEEELASHALAGGILQEGYQCGMLWGASLAIGSEAARRFPDTDKAIRAAVRATQQLMRSFAEREGTILCHTITDCDFSNKASFAKYMLTGRYRHCYTLAQEWAPEAVTVARESLDLEPPACNSPCVSCATRIAWDLEASRSETIAVAGFAGGLGLSGSGCGALAAAIWLKTLRWNRENRKSFIKNPDAKRTLEAFYKATDDRIRCEDITGRRFSSLADHSEYIHHKGCASLLETLVTA